MLLESKRRNTKQKELIMSILRESRVHPTADDIYEMVKKNLPKISISTVYRNLEQMCEIGEIRKLGVGGSQRRYDGNIMPHHHIRCTECGKVDDVHLDGSPNIKNIVQQKSGYEVTGHVTLFFGRCNNCRNTTKS
jgi:Fur family ferric uptake transcriptional regulator